MAGAVDYYADLGLTKDATTSEITKAFRKLALTCHPDRGGDQEQFTKINKAHEVLTDAKARARYDNTGRTTALTPEEEFRESFFGGGGLFGGGGESKRSSGGGGGKAASEAEKEEARKREADRLEAQRRLDEADRRDAERRARLNGDPIPPAPAPRAPAAAAPAPAAAASAPPAGGGMLILNMRVILHSLSSRPELNGLTGVLVAQVQDKWQVRMDNDGGEKLLKAKNLAPYQPTASAAPSPKPAPTPSAPAPAPAAKGGYPNGNAAPAPAEPQWERLCAHPKCNFLVHSDPKLTKTHCCRACQGTQTHMAPNHGPVCEKRKAGRNAVRAEAAPAGGARPAVKAQPPSSMGPSEQPTQTYQIMTEFAFVRQDPVHNAPIYGKKVRGEVFVAAEETFDGWVHLAEEPGWIIKDMQGRQGVGQVLNPVGGEPVLAVPKPLANPGPVTFQVVFKPQIAIRGGPNKQAQIMGMKKFGEAVNAEVQTYGGWVRLQGVNHWALTNDSTFGKLLESQAVQDQAKTVDRGSAIAALEQAVNSRDVNKIQEALSRARAAGVDKAQTQIAEQALAEMKADVARLEAKKKKFRERIEKAKDNERELRDIIDDGAKAGLREETLMAQKILSELQEAKSKTHQKHQGLLDRLAAAAASGDKQEMKAARDAAQKGGVDKKEIARIFSLNIINSSAEKPSQVPSNMPVPPTPDQAPSAPAAAPVQSSPAEPAEPGAPLDLALGVRVAIHSLQNRTELNGVTGILVAQREKGWQVLLFNGAGMKLFKDKYLTPYNKGDEPVPSVSAPSASPPPPPREEPRAEPAEAAPCEEASAESWVCTECDFRNLKNGAFCEACDEPRKGAAPPSAEPAGPQPGICDGRWVGQDGGEWMGTIEGTAIQWADGPLVELTFQSERSFSCEMSAEGVTETFSAELDSEGRLLWCDGDIWIRADQ